MRDGVVKLMQFAGEKMVGVGNYHQRIIAGQTRDNLTHFGDSAVFIVFAMDEKLRLRTTREKRKVAIVDGKA